MFTEVKESVLVHVHAWRRCFDAGMDMQYSPVGLRCSTVQCKHKIENRKSTNQRRSRKRNEEASASVALALMDMDMKIVLLRIEDETLRCGLSSYVVC